MVYFLDFKDQLTFSFNDSRKINISSNINIASKQDNLVYKAIKRFQHSYGVQDIGANIEIKKIFQWEQGLEVEVQMLQLHL